MKGTAPRVILDEYGIERRPLPPLGLDGKPRAVASSLTRRLRALSTADLREIRELMGSCRETAAPSIPDADDEQSHSLHHAPDPPAPHAKVRMPVKRVTAARKRIKDAAAAEDADEHDKDEVSQDQAAEAELAPEPSLSRKEMTELEAVIRGNLERYPDALLLTQVGSFYEVRKK